MTANALTFRFAELVAYLGGSQQLVGTIVSAGMTGALAARFFLGQSIDRYGTRIVWSLNSVLFLIGCIAFLTCSSISLAIYAARIAFSIGLAGMFTCSIVYIQNQVPSHRRTEVIGTLGSSGFIGMILGSQLGDLILNAMPAGQPQFLALFGGAAALGVFYLAMVVYLTRHDRHRRPHETPAAHKLIFRYWPGTVVLVAIMMGIGFVVTTVFLTRFASENGLSGIGTFFTGYAISAFIFRVSLRQWSQVVGRHRMILLGLAGHCLGQVLLASVSTNWQFLLPSIACGFGHALLFPAVISLGAGAFPKEYRGTGTTIVLGFTEVGSLVSAPILGWIIDTYQFPAMFYVSAATAGAIGIVYTCTTGWKVDQEARVPQIAQAIPDHSLNDETDALRERKMQTDEQPATVPVAQIESSV